MAKIENHKYSIEDAFNGCFYVVPDYQREYVWTEKQVNQLLDDINDQINGSTSKEYFIGTILVSPAGQKNHYEVIDGQQRLTTFFLILCALKNRFANEEQGEVINRLISTSYTTLSGDTKTSLKLEPRYENSDEVMNKLVKINAPPEKVRNTLQASGIKSFGSLENLINAYDVIYRYLNANYESKEDLKKYWGYISNNVVFIQISTEVSSALKIFESINERGIGLNPMDLLKNLLFTQVTKEDFAKLKNEWKKITGPLEEQKEKPLRFLRYFLMAKYKIENKRNDSTVREEEIYDWFKENASVCDYKSKPFDFVRKIIHNVDNFVAFSAGQGNDKKANPYMDNLKRLCGGAFSLHYILLLSASNLPQALFDHFVIQLESFLFYYIFTKTPTKELERNFSLWAYELRGISALTDIKEQKIKLNEFLKNRFASSMDAKHVELLDALKRYTLNSMQLYRTQYLLGKLTQYVDMKFNGSITPLQFYKSSEIEHILPNTPTDELLNDFKQKNPDVDYDVYKNKLGNLTLLQKTINIVASNKFFIEKCYEYKKCPYYLTRSIAEIVTVGNNTSINEINSKLGSSYTDWTAATIEKRQEILINLALEVWKIQEIEVP